MLTSRRHDIIKVVRSTPVPVNAAQVFQCLAGKINLATVYRGLQYLEAHDYINAFTLDCKEQRTTRFYYPRCKPHVHFFHCRECHHFFPYKDCMIENLSEEIKKKYHFTISHHVLYFMGICEPCKKSAERRC